MGELLGEDGVVVGDDLVFGLGRGEVPLAREGVHGFIGSPGEG